MNGFTSLREFRSEELNGQQNSFSDAVEDVADEMYRKDGTHPKGAKKEQLFDDYQDEEDDF